jgi:hypothetical protein
MRLEPSTTKSDLGRAFPFSALPELTELLEGQRALTSAVERQLDKVTPYVFHRNES